MKSPILTVLVLAMLALSQPVKAQLYAADIDSDNVYLIYPSASSTTLIGNAGEDFSFSGLAVDSSTDTLYASDITNPGEGGYGLASIDQATAAATFIGDHVNSINIWGLAYVPGSDTLLGADGDNGRGLATIDRATGASTLIGNFGGDSPGICGLTYDVTNQVLYGVNSIGASSLYTIDPATGAATLVGPLGVSLDSNARCGLAWDPASGTVYAGAYNGDLYEVNTSTGAATFLFNTGIHIDALTAVSTTSDTLRVKVTKTFSDGSTDDVDVNLTCNSGLPLQQDFTIAGGDPAGVTFVVQDIPESGANCEVTESGGPAGYTPEMNGGSGCAWEGVSFGYFTCEITNEADPATFTVSKEWVIENGSASDINEAAQVTVYCNNEIDGGSWNGSSYTFSQWLYGDDSFDVTVDTTQQSAECYAVEDVDTQTGIESDSDCGSRTIAAGGSSSCTITNTVFFEGIPTLNQWGLAILAVLMLGIGLVGFRRIL